MNDIPYNINFSFDDNLKEIPDNADEMRQAVDHLETRLIEDSQDDYERMRLSGLVGSLYRILGEYDMAEEHINLALAVSNNLRDRRAQYRNLMRLAHVYQRRKQYSVADRIFKQVIEACESSIIIDDDDSPLQNDLASAYQHYGKCLFDQGHYEIALHMFEKALQIREHKSDISLINMTKHAIQITREKLAIH